MANPFPFDNSNSASNGNLNDTFLVEDAAVRPSALQRWLEQLTDRVRHTSRRLPVGLGAVM